MKLKLKYIGLGILGIILFIGFTTPLFTNLWGVSTSNGYIVPKESLMLTFNVTKMNDGNGDYWLYGEDEAYFYSQMMKDDDKSYIKISRKEANKNKLFDKTNFKTWDNEFLCGDLLKFYAKKPKTLEFISCEKVSNSQTIVRATYRVSGKNSKEVEDFFVNNYGMGKLKWACCGWESQGKYGNFEHKELTKIDPFLSGIITMNGSGEIAAPNTPTGVKLEFDRAKVTYFTVIVELVIV